MERGSQHTTPSVEKAPKILKPFDSTHKSTTLTEISERADMCKGAMVRVLTTLEGGGFVRHDKISKRYSPGMSIYMLNSNISQFMSVAKAIRPCLEKATTELNLIAHLSVFEGGKIVLINRVVPNASAVVFDSNFKIDDRVEVHSTGAGKVLTACSAAEVRGKITSHCSFKSYSERTVMDKNKYRRVLNAVRKSGYTTNEGENEPHLKYITYPTFGYRGKIEVALGLSRIIQYSDIGLEQRCHKALREIREKTSAAMGQSL